MNLEERRLVIAARLADLYAEDHEVFLTQEYVHPDQWDRRKAKDRREEIAREIALLDIEWEIIENALKWRRIPERDRVWKAIDRTYSHADEPEVVNEQEDTPDAPQEEDPLLNFEAALDKPVRPRRTRKPIATRKATV